jgi:malate dehydrogenase (oxaloacetate-decarboxylating)(NADP+)
MEPVFAVARPRSRSGSPYAEGEDERVLRAAQVAVDEGNRAPILIGRTDIIAARIAKLGPAASSSARTARASTSSTTRATATRDAVLQARAAQGRVARAGARGDAHAPQRSSPAILVHLGDADAMLCGTLGDYTDHLRYIRNVFGNRPACSTFAGDADADPAEPQLFICDTAVNRRPDREQLAEMTILAAEQVQRFGLKPSVALLSHSNFGSVRCAVGAEDARSAHADPSSARRISRWRRDARRLALSQALRETEFRTRACRPMRTC